MAQHDYVIDNASGATVRADINSALSAIQTLNSGTSAPSSTAAGMLWLDTTGGAPYALKVRDAGNNHWLTLASVTDPGSDGNIETSATIKGTIDATATLTNATFPSGHVIQVQSTIKTDTTSRTNSNETVDFADITGMSVSITPKSGSKVFVQAMLGVSNTADYNAAVRLLRGSTPIGVGDAAGSRPQATQMAIRAASAATIESVVISFLDLSPGGDGSTAITYKMQWDGENGSTMVLNKSAGNLDRYDQPTTASTITVMEISG